MIIHHGKYCPHHPEWCNFSTGQAITVAELYGVLDPDTRDWTDGLLSNIFREINKSLAEGKDEAR